MYVRHFISPLPCRREIFNGAETGNELVWCLGVWYFFLAFSFSSCHLPSNRIPTANSQYITPNISLYRIVDLLNQLNQSF
jgi:hypothetical protein